MSIKEHLKKIKPLKEAKDFVYPYYFRLKLGLKQRIRVVKCLLWAKKPKNLKTDIPIIINNFNHYDYLMRLIKSLEKRGYTNIHIIDNDSTYPPLLEYYRRTPHTVYMLGKNLGYQSFWKSGIYKKFINTYFVYTDPDLELVEECPDNFMQHFYDILQRYPLASKVGFSLKLDDIPDYYPYKNDVLNWEARFWEKEVEPGLFRAPVDTTFALHRPYTKFTRDAADKIYRTGFPYMVRHLPWYINPDKQSENEIFYSRACQTPTHWGGKINQRETCGTN